MFVKRNSKDDILGGGSATSSGIGSISGKIAFNEAGQISKSAGGVRDTKDDAPLCTLE